MPISINGTGSITGLSAGGLPDASVTADDIASNAITTAKVNDAAITYGKLSTSATEADNVAKRTAKAWVNFDGTTNIGGNCTIKSDFNVSTVSDNGTGDYTVNFSSALAHSDYCCVASASNGSSSGDSMVASPFSPNAGATGNTYSTSSIDVVVYRTGTGAYDTTNLSLAIFAN